MADTNQILLTENVARVPRGFVFPVNPRGPLLVEAVAPSGLEYKMLVGGVSPLGGDVVNREYPGLTMRHGRVLLRIMHNRPFNSPTIRIEMVDLGRIDCPRPTGKSYRNIKGIVEDLGQTWIHIMEPGQAVRSVRMMNFEGKIQLKGSADRSDLLVTSRESNIYSRGIKSVSFAPEFWRACLNYACTWPVRADVVDQMESDLAAFAYLTLGPNTFNPQKLIGHRYLRDAGDLMAEAGLVRPNRSLIKQAFERGRGKEGSILEQINNKEMKDGRFRCEPELKDSADGARLNIVYWREPIDRALQQTREAAEPTGEMFEIWKKETGSAAGFFEAASKEDAMLLGHEIEMMQSIGYHWEASQKFLERVRSFIGGIAFDTVLHGVKLAQTDSVTKGKVIGDLGKYVGGSLMAAYKERVREIAEARGKKKT